MNELLSYSLFLDMTVVALGRRTIGLHLGVAILAEAVTDIFPLG